MNTSWAIEVNDLHKNFGSLKAVNGAHFQVHRGEVLSLLGPNGAGKSTIISVLCGLLEPDQGDALILGHSIRSDPQAAKACLGYVPQEIALYPDLSARENLTFWGKMYGLRGAVLKQRIEEVLDVIGLTSRQKDHISKFSGGMKRRVNIGAALLHKPQVIVMDEPTVGIDPQSRRHILDAVKELNRQGMTVLYTTHNMEEAHELSDHIAIMDMGKVIAYGTHEELICLVGEQTLIDLKINVESDQLLSTWRTVEGVFTVNAQDSLVSVLVDDSNLVLPRLFEIATLAGVRILSVDIQEPDLEAVFLHLTGRALRD